MKKYLFFFIVSVCSVIFTTSCNSKSGGDSYLAEVTVINEAAKPEGSFLLPVSGSFWYDEHQIYTAVAKSGDTIKVLVPVKIKLANQVPYQARVTKNEMNGFYIVETVTPASAHE